MEPKTLYDQYLLTLGNRVLRCGFAFPETAGYFGAWCKKDPDNGDPEAAISGWYWQKVIQNIGPKSPYNEYTAFSAAASAALLASDRFLLHAVAIRRGESAWLLTGPSGVGKSTLTQELMKQHDNGFTVICGDRPVLQKNADGSFFVHPSPWNGKEGWHGAEGAPLAGIICLVREDENRIRKLTTRESAPLLFVSIFQTGEYEADVRKAAELEEALLRNVPVWQLTADDVPGSAGLLYDTLFTGDND